MVLLLGTTLVACNDGVENTEQTGWTIRQIGGLTVSGCTAISEFEVLSSEETISFIAVDAEEWTGEALNMELYAINEEGHERLVSTQSMNASTLETSSSSDLAEAESIHNSSSSESSSSSTDHHDSSSAQRNESGFSSESSYSESSSESSEIQTSEDQTSSSSESDYQTNASENEYAFEDQQAEESENNATSQDSSESQTSDYAAESSSSAKQSVFEALEVLASSETSEFSMDRTEVFLLENREETAYIIRLEFSGSIDASTVHVMAGSNKAVEVQGEFEQMFDACEPEEL